MWWWVIIIWGVVVEKASADHSMRNDWRKGKKGSGGGFPYSLHITDSIAAVAHIVLYLTV